MTIRINDLGKWRQSPPGEAVTLKGSAARRVRIDVNCPSPTRFDVLTADGALTFLAIVQGYETLEFTAPGEAALVPTSEDEVWYYTPDGESTATRFEDAVNLANVANRRARNPELERMMFKMEQNMNRRLAQQADELAAWRELQERRNVEEQRNSRADASDGEKSSGGASVPDATPAGGAKAPAGTDAGKPAAGADGKAAEGSGKPPAVPSGDGKPEKQ